MQHGFGIEAWPDGSLFEGNYMEGAKNGTGNYTWPDGSSYKGNYHLNSMEGHVSIMRPYSFRGLSCGLMGGCTWASGKTI
jgi:hypothetical protein